MLFPRFKASIDQQVKTDPLGDVANFENIYQHFKVHPGQLLVYPTVLFLHIGVFRSIYRSGGDRCGF